MDLVLQSLLPSQSTIQFKEAVGRIINVQDESAPIRWNELEDLIAEYSTNTSPLREYPFLVHHILPKDPPIAVVKAVVMERPESLMLLDIFRYDDGAETVEVEATPLGIACKSEASLDVIRFIIRTMVSLHDAAKKETAEQQEGGGGSRGYYANYTNKNRRGGLFTTTGFGSPTMPLATMNVMLEEHPDGVLFHDSLSKSNLAVDFAFSKTNTEAITASVDLNIRVADDYLDKLRIVLMAASKGTIREDGELLGESSFLLPHAFLEAVTCAGRFRRKTFRDERDYFLLDEKAIVSVLQYLWKTVPQQFMQTDDGGNLPIHIALTNRRSLLHSEKREYGSNIIRFLLECHPESIRMPNGKGWYPVHISVQSLAPSYGMILDATPSWVLETTCPLTGLCPFQIPALYVQNDAQRRLSVEMSYIILQKAPMMARGLAAKRPPWLDSAIFKDIQIAKMKREQLSARIIMLERQLEKLKAAEGGV